MKPLAAAETNVLEVTEVPSAVSDLQQTVPPLPLTPFERYLSVDDRPDYPMTFAAVLDFRGQVVREALQQAVADLRRRHPLLNMRLQRSSRWQQSQQDFLQVIWRETMPTPHAFQGRTIDLAQDPAMLVEAYSQNDRTRLIFSFHHALTDGIGANQIIGDVLAKYGIATSARQPVPRLLKTCPDLLSQRGEIQISLPAPVSRWVATRAFLQETLKLLACRPQRLHAATPPDREQSPDLGMIGTTIPNDLFRDYSQQAGRHGATTNDLFIRDLFYTIKQWNSNQRFRSKIRLTIPTNLRSRRDLKMPATNILGYAFLTRHQAACDRSKAFLTHIASDMKAVRQWGLGAMFLAGVGAVDRIPGALFLMTRLCRSFATAVFSNLGDPTRRFRAVFPRDEQQRLIAGNLVLENYQIAPPVRPGTRIAIAVTTYRGIASLGMQYDCLQMSGAEAHEFLLQYANQIKSSSLACID